MALIETALKVELRPPDPAWAVRAAEESQRWAGVLGDNLIRIEHIGSTAIPGIWAKPTVDLLPIVRSLEAVDAVSDAILAMGYQYRGEFGLPGRRYCPLDEPGTGLRLMNVHIFAEDSPQIARHLAFRDYLRAHPEEAREYETQKRRAAALHPDNVLTYNDAKSDWIKACECRALAWVNGVSAGSAGLP